MKRITAVFLAISALAATTAFADEVRRSYLVGTRPTDKTPMVRDVEQRATENYSIVSGFAAELTDDEAEALRRQPGVRFVEPDLVRYATETRHVDRDGTKPAAMRPIAPLSRHNRVQSAPYGIGMIKAPRVWSINTGQKIRVGVIDTGIDMTHPDLMPLLRGGYDFVNKDNNPQDDHGHGTHVAGTIAAMNNDFGVVGVAPNVELYALKVMSPDDEGGASGNSRNIIAAVDWAVANHLHVINLSLGGDSSGWLEEEAYRKAVDAGLIVVAASGNDGEPSVSFPAAYPGVVAVGSVNTQSVLSTFSNTGPELRLVAPGEEILSTYPQGFAKYHSLTTNDGREFEGAPPRGAGHGTITRGFVFAGIGRTSDFPTDVAGKIALIKRGELTFNEKVKNAMTAGAAAAVIFDNGGGNIGGWTLIRQDCDALGQNCVDNPSDLTFNWISVMGIAEADGEALKATPNATITLEFDIDDAYAISQGTSMASPHVAGAAALVWSIVPDATAAQVIDVLFDTAKDLGPTGFDNSHGFGLVDVEGATHALAPWQFPPPRKTRRR
ncbi:MAG: S8 family serine peptidase [Thermoanaerobaculia bacterium]